MAKHFWDMIGKYNQRMVNGPIKVSRIHGTPHTGMYTGGGPDGIVQPDRPALIDMSSGRPSIVHEGEMMTNHPNGGKQVTSNKDIRRGITPLTTNAQQQQVSQMEKGTSSFVAGGRMSGYRAGGHMSGYRGGGRIPGYQNGGRIPGQETNALGLAPQSQTPFAQARSAAIDPQGQPLTPAPQNQVSQTGLFSGTQTQGLTPQRGFTPTQTTQAPQQAAQADPVAPDAGVPAPAQPPKPQSELPFEKREATPENIQAVLDEAPPEFKTVGDYKKFYQKGLLQLQKLSEGDSELYNRLRETYIGQQSNIHAAQQAATQQRNLGQGLSPELSRVVGQQQRRQQAVETGNLMNKLAEQEANAAINATNQVVQQGLLATQFEIKQQKDLLDTLIKQGGSANLEQAQQVYMELYGRDIDIERLKNTQAMGDVADIAAMGLGIEQSIEFAKQQGILESFGISEDQLRNMMTPLIMASNPIIQAQSMYADLVSQGTITQEQADQAMAVMEWSFFNPQGLEISNSFVVTNAEGNEVGNFKTEDEANNFIADNAGKNYTKAFKKDGWIGLAGSYEEYFGSQREDDVFIDGGQLFRIVNGQKVAAKITPLQPFSSMNNSLYKYYMQNGQEDKANEVLNLQVDYLRSLEDIDGDIENLPAGITKDHPAYIAWLGDDGSGGTATSTSTSTSTSNTEDVAENVGETAGENVSGSGGSQF